MSKLPAVLREISTPKHLNIEVEADFGSLMARMGRRSIGFSGVTLIGTAFIQGGRLQFTTAMSVRQLLELSIIDRAKPGASTSEVLAHSNRPGSPGHQKKLRDYLMTTACADEKFILPSFTLNLGVNVDEEMPDVTLILMGGGLEDQRVFPAVLQCAQGVKITITDGGHRFYTLLSIARRPVKPEDIEQAEQTERLLANAVAATIVFESSASDSHQDFADCGKTKPIGKSQLTAYDVRDVRNKLATELGKSHPFLAEYVEATANNVNLSKGSVKIYSLAAIRTMIHHIVEDLSDPSVVPAEHKDDAKLVQRLPTFLDAVIAELPQLKALEDHRLTKKEGTPSIAPRLRDIRGGDVALRMVGLAILARAYCYCIKNKMTFADMARRLSAIDWHALDCETDDLVSPDPKKTFPEILIDHANPIWKPVLVIRPRRHKISSSSADATKSWELIEAKVLQPPALAAE